MLSNATVSIASSVGINAKQISLAASLANAVVYTVPAGKKFIGYITSSSAYSDYGQFKVNGVIHTNAYYQSSGGMTMMSRELTFLAGTVISTLPNSNNVSILGIESDA